MRFAAEFAIFIVLDFCPFILFLFPNRITHIIIGETCFVNERMNQFCFCSQNNLVKEMSF